MSQSGKNGLTYSDAGVDIDAGNLMVEKIKPAVRSTRRPGADGEIGGFGGLFDLKAAGFAGPASKSVSKRSLVVWTSCISSRSVAWPRLPVTPFR